MRLFKRTSDSEQFQMNSNQDENDVALIYGGDPGDYTEQHYNNYLELTTDATDTADPVDGIPDIPADGVSSCTITIQKKNGETDADMVAAGDDDTVTLTNTRGALSVLQVDLVNGTADVTLTSVAETCISDIVASADGLDSGSIQIQFAPPVA